MEKLWYNKLGFNNNPFSIKTAAFHNELFGLNMQDTINKIETGSIIFIEGDYGTGKTTLLKGIVNKFGGKKKIIYYSCNRTEDNINVDKLMTNRTFFSKIFKTKPNDLILLLDEAQDLNETDS